MKSSKKRECPVVERVITSAECGENRQSKWKCPESCPHNPWSFENYDQALDIYDLIQPHLFGRLKPTDIQKVDTLFRSSPGIDREVRVQQTMDHSLYLQLDADGLSTMTRWQRDQWPGLRNDTRVQAEAFLTLRIALTEVLCVLDDRRVEVVDLLRPAIPPFIICDYKGASLSSRFETNLMLIWDAPHHTRIMGVALPIEAQDPFSALETVRMLATHQGAPAENEALAGWIRLNFHNFCRAAIQLKRAQSRRMIQGMDTRPVTVRFKIKNDRASEVLVKLENLPEIESDPPTLQDIEKGIIRIFGWYDGSLDTDEEQISIGSVRFGEMGFELFAFNEKQMTVLREKFETLAGDAVEFTGERVEDIAAQLQARHPDLQDNEDLIPPELLARAHQISSKVARFSPPDESMSKSQLETYMLDKHARSLLSQTIPMLENKTPVEAAKDPSLRPALLTWAKIHICNVDRRNLEHGTNSDMNWLVDELGLHEISFPPPPPRPALREQ